MQFSVWKQDEVPEDFDENDIPTRKEGIPKFSDKKDKQTDYEDLDTTKHDDKSVQ